MTTDDKTANGDDALKAYLDGRDGLSATYARTAREEPPAALDAAILQAARAGVVPAAHGEPKARQGKWALAASLVLGMGLSSLYYEGREAGVGDVRYVPASSGVGEDSILITGARIGAPDSAQDAQEKADTASLAEAAAQPAAVEPPRPAPAVQAPQAVAPPVAVEPPRPAPIVQAPLSFQELSLEGEQARVVVSTQVADSRRLPPTTGIAEANEARVLELVERQPPGGMGQREEAEAPAPAAEEVSEEIMVTGSRILRDSAGFTATATPLPAWRATETDWLAYIAERQRTLRRLAGEQAVLQAELEAELAAFREQHPDVDLDGALDVLTQE